MLDVACGTGVAALTAARAGAQVQGIDLTPELIARAKENAALARLEVAFQESDAESLPFPDSSFPQWGEPNVVRERLGSAVRDLTFTRNTMFFPTLSPQHYRVQMAENFGPAKKLFEQLDASDPGKAAALRAEIDTLAQAYFEDNRVRQDLLLTRAVKI